VPCAETLPILIRVGSHSQPLLSSTYRAGPALLVRKGRPVLLSIMDLNSAGALRSMCAEIQSCVRSVSA